MGLGIGVGVGILDGLEREEVLAVNLAGIGMLAGQSSSNDRYAEREAGSCLMSAVQDLGAGS